MKTKYNNDSIIGGKNITASYTKNGELLRVMYPFPDFRSWIDEFKTGVKINDSGIIYLHEDINNQYNQYVYKNDRIIEKIEKMIEENKKHLDRISKII